MEIELSEFGVRIRLTVEPIQPTIETATPSDEEAHPLTMEDEEAQPLTMEDEEAQPLTMEEQRQRGMDRLRDRIRTRLESSLRGWRRDEAIRRGVPSYIVLNENTIRAIVETIPATKDVLRGTKGVGPKTMELYGDALVDIVHGAVSSPSEEE